MKKLAFITIAALTMILAACGNQDDTKKDGKSENETSSQASNQDETNGENKSKGTTTGEVSYITYTNEKYGFSVDVPKGMIQKGELMGDEGTVFSADSDDSGITFNRIDISGGKQYFDEEYTPEKVKEEFEDWLDGKDVTTKECGDNYFSYTIKGQYVNELHRFVYNGTKKAMISICYEDDHEKQLGGEVAEHVFNSVKFK